MHQRKGVDEMTNTALLEDYIKKSGKKKMHLAAKVGLSSAGFRNCCINKAEFTASQIQILCDELDIRNLKQKQAVFFAQVDA
jgi:hypothetical protein